MTIKARFPVEVGGHIYRRGETMEWTQGVTPRIADNFTAADGSPLVPDGAEAAKDAAQGRADAAKERDAAVKAAVKRTVETMGRDGIRRALDAMNVTYSSAANTERLARKLLASRGEFEEA